LALPFASAAAAGAHAEAIGVRVTADRELAGALSAWVPIDAARALAAIELPADLALTVGTGADGVLELHATVADRTVHAFVRADVATRTVRGIAIGEVPDAAPLTRGAIAGRVLAVATFTATADRARGIVSVHGADGVGAIAFDATRAGGDAIVAATARGVHADATGH